jgi:hypothetical protein
VGTFVNASAFQTTNVQAVRAAVASFFAEHSWPAELVEPGAPTSADDVALYEPANGWTVVLWPQYFIEIAAAEHISRRLATVASTVGIHDGDYWRHVLLRDGVVLDRFASMPGYFTDDPAESERLSMKYRGNAETVAHAVGCGVEQVAAYLVHVDLDEVGDDDEGFEVTEPELGKAFPDDQFERDDPWVFVDFWRRLGPLYPQDVTSSVARIRPRSGWMNRLPVGDSEL